MKSVIISLLLLASTVATAREGSHPTGYYLIEGSVTCGAYAKYRLLKDGQNSAHLYWINGYLTAINNITPDTYSIRVSVDKEGLLAWLDNYCKANPLFNLSDAISDLFRELYPRRFKTRREATP